MHQKFKLLLRKWQIELWGMFSPHAVGLQYIVNVPFFIAGYSTCTYLSEGMANGRKILYFVDMIYIVALL